MVLQPSAFVVWGAGGHGTVVGELVRSLGHELVGFVDRDPAKLGRSILDSACVRWLEGEWLAEIRATGRYASGARASALGIGDNRSRQECLTSLGKLDAPHLVHPSAVVSPTARLGSATVVLPLAVVHSRATLEEGVIVNTGAIIEHDCELGPAVHVSPGATLCGGVRVGPRSWIGAGATVVPGTTIGADVTVGAGALVLRDVRDGERVIGVPARPRS